MDWSGEDGDWDLGRGREIGGDVHDHLLAAKEGVADEFAGAQRDWLLAVGHGRGLAVAVSMVVLEGKWEYLY